MDRSVTLYLIPLFVSCAISLAIAAFCWWRRSIPGAGSYALVALGQGLNTAGYVLELTNPTLNGKIFWDNAQWITSFFIAICLISFARSFTGERHFTWRAYLLISILPVIIILLAYTNDLHLLIRPDAHLVAATPFGELAYSFTTADILAALYLYTLALATFVILFVRFFRSQPLFRWQILVIILGNLIPFLGSILTLVGVNLGYHRDITPYTFVLSNLMVAWGLFRLRLFHIAPVAHDTLFASMTDFVYVVDDRDRLVDLNPAAKRILNRPSDSIIGLSLAEVFPQRLDVIKRFDGINEASEEIEIEDPSGVISYFDVRVSPLRNRSGRISGRLVVARDNTARRRAEKAEAEQRVVAEALINVAQALSSTLDLTEVLERVLLNLERVIPYTHAEILLLEGDVARLVGSRTIGIPDNTNGFGLEGIVHDSPFLKQMAESGQSHLIPSIRRDSLTNVAMSAVLSMVGAPIISENNLLGFINLGSIEENFYSPQHSKILRAFADQAAIAIENANLYQITQATAEQALAYSALQLARSNALIVSLAEVASRVGTTLDLDIICETLGTELEKLGMQTVVNVLELDGKTLATHYMTIDLNTQKEINEALGLSGSNYAGPMIVADADTTHKFIEARRAELEANPVDYFAATIFSSIPRSRAEELLHQVGIDSHTTLFWFPLMVKDQVVGTMTVWGKNLEKRDNLALSAFAGNVASAILNARLYQAEHEQRELAEALRDSAAALNSTLSLSEVLNRILDNVGRVLPHDTANIMLIEDGVAHVVGKRGYAERDLDSELEIARWRVEELFDLRSMYETGQPLAIPDTQVEPNWLTLPNYEWIRSLAGAPIQLGDKVIGFINLESATAGFFSANDALRLQAFAQQASIAIHNARLYQAEREQRELSDALKRSASALSSTLSLEEVLDRILDNVGEVLPHDAANIMLIESGVGYMVGKRGYTQRGLDEQVKAARWVVKDIPNMRTIFETKKPLVIPDTQANPDWVVRRESSWIRSIVGAPIIIENEVIGLLNLDSATPKFFTDKDAIRLQAFADQAAIGIHNAHLYEAERYERILAQTLQKTASALIRTIETQDTLTLIMDQLAEVVPYDHVLLMMVEEAHLRLVASRGFLEDQPSASGDYPYSEITFMRNILASGKPLVVGDIQSHEYVGDLPGVLPTTRAWMAIPLITWGVVTGLLIVGCNQQDRYNDKTLGAGVAFAQQAAIAIENVRMVAHLSETVFNLREAQARLERAARLSAAGEIAAGVAHQINNPLTAIIAESGLLLQDLTPVDPGYESAVAIREAANLAGSIVQRQLNLSRSIPYSMQPVDINQSLSNAVSLIYIQIESIAALILNLQSDLPDVMGSPEHLADVWLNLLLNARDALVGKEQGQIHITTKLIIDENMILIRIEDNGQGISQEHLGRIFDPFFTTKVRGHGLGLPVCYEVIRRHHGTITVDSQQGIGTTISITLPLINDGVREQASEDSGNVSYSHH